ncbi:MAG: tRNA pseudouridine(55) synthase TruB, partial [Pirellulaceae bacterium]
MFGILNCNKPVGLTSRTIVDLVQRRVRPAKAGHAGTLDPLASGVLLVGVGAGVRLVPYLQQQPKHYTATFRLGVRTESGDLEGEPIPHPIAPRPTRQQIDAAMQQQIGTIEQTPPAHSAIKIGGQRAYDLVRSGKPVEMKARRVVIDSIHLRRYEYPELELEIICGSGTYVRSIGIDIADLCNTYAVMTSLVRTRIGSFGLDEAVSTDQLREADLSRCLSPLIAAVPQLPQVTLDDPVIQRVEHGQVVPVEIATDAEEIAAVDRGGTLRGIMIRRPGGWRARRVFPNPG